MSILDAAAALIGGLIGGDNKPTNRPSINNRPVQGPSLGRREVAARRESAGLATTGRSVRSTGGNVRVKDATNLTTRDDKPKRDKPYQPGMRSAFGLPTRAAHSRMRMDDFAGLAKTRKDPSALEQIKNILTYRTEASRRAEDAARNMSMRERVEGFAPSVDEPDPMQALMMSLAGLRVGAAPTRLALPAGPRVTGMAQPVPGTGGPVGPAGLIGRPGGGALARGGGSELASLTQRLLGSGPRVLPNGQYNMGPAQPTAPFQMPPNGGYPLSLF